MKNKSSLWILLATVASVPGIAFAEPDPAPAAPDAQPRADDILVTGSRLGSANQDSISPIAVVDGDVFRDQGTVNVEAFLNKLPQVKPGLGSQNNDNNNGTATIDIRGLGPSRTLVLVNNRRLVPSDYQGQVDVNNINTALIERVDIVTGGASAVYGSDALGGVVNFVYKRDFEGLELNGQTSISDEGDGAQYVIGATAGTNFAGGRGNITIAGNYFRRNPLFQGARDFYRVDRVANGSALSGVTLLTNVGLNPTPGGQFTFDANGDPRAFVNSLPENSNGVGDRFNQRATEYITTPQDRYLVNLLAHYEFSPAVEAYIEGSYVDSRVTTRLAPTPASTGFAVDPTSPVLSDATRALLASRPDPTAAAPFQRRFLEVGNRFQAYRYRSTQINAGLRGDIGGGWRYDVYYAYGETRSSRDLQGDVSRSRVLAGVNGCPAGSPAGCVPVDIFTPGGLTAEAIDYIRLEDAVNRQRFRRHNVVGSLSGSLVDLPAGPLEVALGAEYRRDSAQFRPSEAARTGDVTGYQTQQNVSGHFDTKEVFAEARVPLLADQPFADYLGIEAGARYSDYSSVGSLWTWKAGAQWAPIADLRLRGTFQRAARAPSVFELYQGGDTNYPTIADPCARITPTGATIPASAISAAVATICQIQGLPDPRTNVYTQLAASVETLSVGNPTLNEEQSDTWTLGGILRPRFLPGFSLSVDYFNIDIDGYVARLGGGVPGTVAACFASGVTTAAEYDANVYCAALGQRLATGALSPTSPFTNSGQLKTNGYDIQVRYDLGLGGIGLDGARLLLDGSATYTRSFELDGVEYQGLSTTTFGTLPKWRSNLRGTFRTDAFELSLNWSRIGSVVDRGQSLGNGEYKRVGDENYFDLGSSVKIGERFDLYGGVRNLFDNDAPFIGTGYRGANSDISLYDAVGRVLFVGFTARF